MAVATVGQGGSPAGRPSPARDGGRPGNRASSRRPGCIARRKLYPGRVQFRPAPGSGRRVADTLSSGDAPTGHAGPSDRTWRSRRPSADRRDNRQDRRSDANAKPWVHRGAPRRVALARRCDADHRLRRRDADAHVRPARDDRPDRDRGRDADRRGGQADHRALAGGAATPTSAAGGATSGARRRRPPPPGQPPNRPPRRQLALRPRRPPPPGLRTDHRGAQAAPRPRRPCPAERRRAAPRHADRGCQARRVVASGAGTATPKP